MPYRALLYTLVTLGLVFLSIGMWVSAVAPMVAEVNASTQPSPEHPAISTRESQTSPAPPDKQFKRTVKGTMLLAFVLACMLLAVGFFATFREWVRFWMEGPTKAKRTRYVDAWKIAGERLDAKPPEVPGDDSL